MNDEEQELSFHSKNNYFEILCSFCFFENEDPLESDHNLAARRDPFKSPLDLHDLYIDKLQFFIDSLSLLSDIHINLFSHMINSPKFKTTILGLLAKGETSLRLKAFEILELVTNYYAQYCVSKTVYEIAVPNSQQLQGGKKQQNEVMEVEYINQDRLYISQLVIHCVKQSIDQHNPLSSQNDAYLQFNSLILLDFLFQNLLPVPTFQNE